MTDNKDVPAKLTVYMRAGDQKLLRAAVGMLGDVFVVGSREGWVPVCDGDMSSHRKKGNNCTGAVHIHVPSLQALDELMTRLLTVKESHVKRDERCGGIQMVTYAQRVRGGAFIKACVL